MNIEASEETKKEKIKQIIESYKKDFKGTLYYNEKENMVLQVTKKAEGSKIPKGYIKIYKA